MDLLTRKKKNIVLLKKVLETLLKVLLETVCKNNTIFLQTVIIDLLNNIMY